MTERLGPRELLERLQRAQNDHDIVAFVGCFAIDYRSEQPAHPDRAFTGRDQIRMNWSSVFESVPDFHADLIATAFDGATGWAEALDRHED